MSVRVELLIIGNEILSGRIQDTNSQWLAQRLLELSLPVRYATVVEDDVEIIARTLRAGCDRGTQILITSGGLGPTFDDCTAEALARAAEVVSEFNEQALTMIQERLQLLHAQGLISSSDLTPPRRKMAFLPRGAEPLHNSVGTAPGIAYKLGATQIYCLPGVPRELQVIFTSEVQPRLIPLAKGTVLEEVLEVPFLDESVLVPAINAILATEKGVYLKTMPSLRGLRHPLRIVVTVTADTQVKAQQVLRHVIQRLERATKPARPFRRTGS
jgi:molybdenum cofactor synthesis domain-containing protein